jgi:hypothetical protein
MKDASVFVDEGGGEATLHVYDMGQVAEGDQVMVEGDPTKGLVVGPVDQAAGTVFVTRLGYPGVTVILGNRLILKKVGLTNGRIKVYTDPLGTAPFANDQITLETGTGRARGYVREYKYDYVVTVTGEPAPRAFANAEGSFVMRT